MVHLEYSVEKPLNREPDMEKLVSSFITAEGYDRNHGPIPHMDASTHRVSVSGLVTHALSLSIADLAALPQHTVVCALQCAGNRRHTMRTKLKEVSGIDWFDGAVMNCRWRGPLLCDVLAQAGVCLPAKDQRDGNDGDDDDADAHVAFACHQTPTQDDAYYGSSIPLSRALSRSASVLLALRMNNAPLPPNHGGPVRIVAPGIAGARSVKWLDGITVQRAESANYYQQHDYKILPPEADCAAAAAAWWPRVAALHDMPVNSVVGVPRSGSTVRGDERDGMVLVKGYALPAGAEGPVARVEVSGDGGETWVDAELVLRDDRDGNGGEEEEGEDDDADPAELKWAWCLWSARVKIARGKDRTVLSRATDASGNSQERCSQWNFRGVAYNGYGEATGLEVV
ncbi:sulfite oxidase-like protein [Massariosphaeria phaeospora]|uniref:Sulfite oxidase-like protein n=1 Tax=Massariosphaeria phaeospora TaxID=100035 RepID=A0A7C8I350_9PLEO|nr:sulfite oxidase-like protein [Massariosphaeria phaeospora]